MRIYLFLIAFAFSAVNAEELKKFEPADFKDSGSSFSKNIKFPAIKWEGTMVIRCDAYVSHLGKFLSNYCFDKSEKAFPFVSAINYIAKNARIKPARVDGISKEVWFQYYVTFTKKGKKSLIEAIQNSGLQAGTYGTNYTSAQRYKDDSGNFAVGCGTAYDNMIIVKAIIGVNGKAKATQVEGKNISETCKENLIRDFSEQEFIPAFVNGKAVDSFYSEEIFNRYRKW